MDIKLGDIVRYKTIMIPEGAYGKVVRITKVEKSLNDNEKEGDLIYLVQPLENELLGSDVLEENIFEVYSLVND